MLISLGNCTASSCLCLWLLSLPLPSCSPNVQYYWYFLWSMYNWSLPPTRRK